MKLLLSLLALALLPLARGNDVLVYKLASPRTWAQYEAANPDLLSGGVPRTTLKGRQAISEYWILDQTTMDLQVVRYFLTYVRGVAAKQYEVDAVVNLNKGIRAPRWIATKVPGTFTLCLSDGLTVTNSTGLSSSFENFFTGTAKSYTVAPGIIIPKVAAVLSGEHVGSERENTMDAPANTMVLNRRVLLETGTQTLTLDAVLTKQVHTTGTVPERGTLAFATQLVRTALLKLGYDFTSSTP